MRFPPVLLLLACRGSEPSTTETPSCEEAAAGHQACAAADPGRPECVDGACAACASPGPSDACAAVDPATPICAPSGACVACIEHEQCASNVCDRAAQVCVPEEAIIHVQNEGFLGDRTPGEDDPGCGVPERPCLTLRYAAAERIDETAGRVWIRVADGRYSDEAVAAGNRTVHVVGGSDVEVYADLNLSEPAFSVEGGGDLHLDRLVVFYGTRGVDCAGADRNPAHARVERTTLRLATVCVDADPDCVIELDQVALDTCERYGVDGDRADVTVRRSTVGPSHHDAMGLRLNRGSLVLEQSLVQGNEDGGVSLYETDFRIVNNVIAGNGDSGDLGSTVGGLLIERDGPERRELAFNTIAYNRVGTYSPYAPGIDCATFAGIDVRNSVVWGNQQASDADPQIQGFCEVSYSNVQNGVVPEGNLTAGPGVLDTDPLFADVPRADFRLEQGSRAIDAADPQAMLDVDLEGNPRPLGAGHDMGAYEWSGDAAATRSARAR